MVASMRRQHHYHRIPRGQRLQLDAILALRLLLRKCRWPLLRNSNYKGPLNGQIYCHITNACSLAASAITSRKSQAALNVSPTDNCFQIVHL